MYGNTNQPQSEHKISASPIQLTVGEAKHTPIKELPANYQKPQDFSWMKERDKVTIVSVDPGLRGALAFFFKTSDKKLAILTHSMPLKRNTNKVSKRKRFVDPLSILAIISEYVQFHKGEKLDLGIIEQVHAFPHQGVVSMFNFGKEAGIVEGILWTISSNMYHAHPKSWKQRYNLHGKKRSPESFLKELQHKVSLIQKNNSHAFSEIAINYDSDGHLEAVLIGLYALEKLGIIPQVWDVKL